MRREPNALIGQYVDNPAPGDVTETPRRESAEQCDDGDLGEMSRKAQHHDVEREKARTTAHDDTERKLSPTPGRSVCF